MPLRSLDIGSLRSAYLAGGLTPTTLVRDLLRRSADADDAIWIHAPEEGALFAAARALEESASPDLPLYGIPFAVKDNIDVAGVPTTAACPAFSFVPARSAPVVERLVAAGALFLGKTNLDQFATGLVGVRSPYGVPANSFDPEFVPGGSSSGSAVAVAAGLVSFSLGTDTAGSGRVPAAFNNIVGLKPTRGALSTRGVVPACRSLDCVSIFALSVGDAEEVRSVCEGYDEEDPFSRRAPVPRPAGAVRVVGIPADADLAFFGDDECRSLFERSVAALRAAGAEMRVIDYGPFREAAELLYGGPWVAERYLAVERLLRTSPEALHPVTRTIVASGDKPRAADAFRAQYRLAELRRAAEAVWRDVDALMTPTAGTIYRLADLEADPVGPNSNLGYYTNHLNLLDMCGVAVPAGFRPDGLPFGVTLSAPAWRERALLRIADTLHRAAVSAAGATGLPLPAAGEDFGEADDPTTAIAVCGAHMSGMPLNGELTRLGGTLRANTTTAAAYRLFALAGPAPARPGLVRTSVDGAAIELEVWELPRPAIGSLLSNIRAPLGLGEIELADGSFVHGFLCETAGTREARDITGYGGWRSYQASLGRHRDDDPQATKGAP